MSPSRSLLWSVGITRLLLSFFIVSGASAQSIDAMLNAPGWDVAYSVEFKSSDSGTDSSFHGPISYTRSVFLASSVTLTLDMRNMGSTLGMLRASMNTDPSSEEAQQAMIDLSMRAESMANWMSGGPLVDETASDADQMAAVTAYMESSKGPGRIDYTMSEKGENLTTEIGTKYSLNRTTTAKGAGTVLGPTSLMFEIDAEAKTYLLTLAHSFGDKSDSTVLTEVVTVTTMEGQAPQTSRETARSPLGRIPGVLRIDDPSALIGEAAFFQGEIDPASGKISGERTVRGHYESGARNVPGTFTFRYTLTPRT